MAWPPPGIDVRENVPLASCTTFRIGGPARWFADIDGDGTCAALMRAAREAGLPFRIIGGGANLLVDDAGVAGLVVRIRARTAIHPCWPPDAARGDSVAVVCEAGWSLPRWVRNAADAGWSGVEDLAAIPGTLGGALAMNAGGTRPGEGLADRVEWIEGLSPDGTPVRLTPPAWTPRYRDGVLGGMVALRAGIRMTAADPAAVRAATEEAARKKSAAQPLDVPSAGCVFRNAPGLSSGRMIDQAGCKGMRRGDAMVSERHANFIVNAGHARAGDVRALIEDVREAVMRVHGQTMALEIQCWP